MIGAVPGRQYDLVLPILYCPPRTACLLRLPSTAYLVLPTSYCLPTKHLVLESVQRQAQGVRVRARARVRVRARARVRVRVRVSSATWYSKAYSGRPLPARVTVRVTANASPP